MPVSELIAQSGRRCAVDVLLACARVTLDSNSRRRLVEACRTGVDWPWLTTLAQRHGVTALVHRHLAREIVHCDLPDATAFDKTLSALGERARLDAFKSLTLEGQMVGLAAAFESSNLPAAFFKGPLLARAAYGDPSLRTFVDLDVLVRAGDVQRALEVLQASGYRRTAAAGGQHDRAFHGWNGECTLFNDDHGAQLDLHWRLTMAYYPAQFDVDGMLKRAKPVSVGGRTVAGLDEVDMFVLLCVHGAKHLWSQLRWLCDVAEIVRAHPAFPWGAVVGRASEAGAERMLIVACELARRALGVGHPLAVPSEATRLVDVFEARLRATRADDGPLAPLRENILGTRLTANWWHKLRYVLGAVFTPTEAEWDALRLPPALFPLYYLVRPLRLAARHARLSQVP